MDVAGIRGITADTGLRLARFFEMSEAFWTGLQADYDAAQTKDAISKTLSKIRPWRIGAQQRVPAAGPRAARSARR